MRQHIIFVRTSSIFGNRLLGLYLSMHFGDTRILTGCTSKIREDIPTFAVDHPKVDYSQSDWQCDAEAKNVHEVTRDRLPRTDLPELD